MAVYPNKATEEAHFSDHLDIFFLKNINQDLILSLSISIKKNI